MAVTTARSPQEKHLTSDVVTLWYLKSPLLKVKLWGSKETQKCYPYTKKVAKKYEWKPNKTKIIHCIPWKQILKLLGFSAESWLPTRSSGCYGWGVDRIHQSPSQCPWFRIREGSCSIMGPNSDGVSDHFSGLGSDLDLHLTTRASRMRCVPYK
jgi:hypothetical protein